MSAKNSMKRMVILGTGGNCIDILDIMDDINMASGSRRYMCVGFLDDDSARWGETIHGIEVLGPLNAAQKFQDCCFVNGIGSPASFWKKPEIIARTGLSSDRFETIVHPSAVVSKWSWVGSGVVIFQNVTINSGAKIGDHVIILPGGVISHDCVVGSFSCVAAGACLSGGVQVGRCCYLGSGSTVINDILVGEGALVGMGTVVLHDVLPDSVVVGNPARFLRRTQGRLETNGSGSAAGSDVGLFVSRL